MQPQWKTGWRFLKKREMIGFSQADVRRIKAQELRNRGLGLVNELTEEEPNADQ